MEAATLGRGGPAAFAQSFARRPGALARLLDRRRADRAGGGAALRHPRRAGLPPRRDRHRQPGPARRLLPRDGRGRLQRVGAAALLRARLVLDAGDRDRRVRAALALGAGRGGDGPGRLPASAPSCAAAAPGLLAAALVAVNPMLLWYSQEARAYALLVLLLRALAALLRARPARRRSARDFVLWGRLLRPRPRAPTTSPSSRSLVEVVLLAAPARRRERSPASGSSPLPSALLAPLALPPDVLRPRRMDRQLHASATGSGRPSRPS